MNTTDNTTDRHFYGTEVTESASSKVNYNSQCHAWAPNSKERCAMCDNHPGDHIFPVTAQRDAALAALRECQTSDDAACFRQMKLHPEWMKRRLDTISGIARAVIAATQGG